MANRGLNLLILEDSYYIRCEIASQIKRILPEVNFVAMVEECTEAIEILQHENVDVVVADSEVADGGTINTFIDAGISVPLILISEWAELYKEAQQLNLVGFILKPVTQNALEKVFEHVSSLSHSNNLKLKNNMKLKTSVLTGMFAVLSFSGI